VDESDLDYKFAELATIIIASIVDKAKLKINHKLSFQSRARHFLAWNRTVF